MTKRVLICANPDLNFIDGSSIWAQTIALATAATGCAQVDFLAKSKPERDELYGPLNKNGNITICDGTNPQLWGGKRTRRLSMPMMAELAIKLDRTTSYDVIIVRGLEIATLLLDAPDVLAKCWMYLTDIPQSPEEYSAELRRTMQRIARGCHSLLCQTEGFKSLWRTLVPDLDADKMELYTPVIPDLSEGLPSLADRPQRAIYAGKFKGDWMTLEMAQQWPSIHSVLPDSELIMIGDKIHAEATRPEYQSQMQQALESTPGLRWLGAQSREMVQSQLQQARVGLSWRDENMNDTVEYSTKILEYGGAGCAAILNRNPLHEQLLGQDYPLFANSAEEFVAQLKRALSDDRVASQAAHALQQLARRHTFSSRVGEIRHWLEKMPAAQRAGRKIRVLVAGHDLKFFNLLQKNLEGTGQFEFCVDKWDGHNRHNEARSRAMLENADVIFCEWCLGNLKWYSENKKPHQRLVARFHGQERMTSYLSEAVWDNIDHISYVSELIQREGQKVFDFPSRKTSVIPNLIDDKKFTRKRKTGDARYVLGIIGVAPSLKRLDRAIDLLRALLEEDNRYSLRVKGKHPLEYAWLLKREEELEYYRNIFNRINSDPKLRHRVIFDPAGDDINDWFTMVGFILSPSDFESFHMAVGEGILTGATPVVWERDGASEIWSSRFVAKDTDDAKRMVLNGMVDDVQEFESFERYLPSSVSREWSSILMRRAG